jgi:multidrug efflux pump subunit AcrA (membrane-fusion protein)
MKVKTILIRVFPMILAILIPLGCRGNSADTEHSAGPQHTPLKASDIVVEPVVAREIDLSREFAGSVRSRTVSHISARVMAQVIDVRVEEGGTVRKGELVIRLDDRQLKAKAGQAEGALKRAEAGLELATLTLGRYDSLLEEDGKGDGGPGGQRG